MFYSLEPFTSLPEEPVSLTPLLQEHQLKQQQIQQQQQLQQQQQKQQQPQEEEEEIEIFVPPEELKIPADIEVVSSLENKIKDIVSCFSYALL